MLHVVLGFLLLLCGLSTASADAASECLDPGTPPDRAIRACSAVIQKDARAAGAYLQRGDAYLAHRDYDRALADFEKAIALSPTDMRAYNGRGRAFHAQRKSDRAMADFNKAIQIAPQLAGLYNNRGVVFEDQGNLDRALADYDKAIEIDPKRAFFYGNRGRLFSRRGDFDRSIADYEKAIEVDPKAAGSLRPDLAGAYEGRGRGFARSGDLDRAFADYEKAIEIDPKRTLSYLFERRKEPERAVGDLDRAIKANPNTAVTYHIRGKFHEMLGRLDLALADYGKAAALNPTFARECASNGFVFKEWVEPEKHEEMIEASINANPNAAFAYFNRGALLHGKGKYGWAILDYDKTLDLDPTYAPAHYNRGVAYESRDDFERAFADYHGAAELDPNSACYARARGMARYRRADFSGAAADLLRATAVRPDADAVLFRYLARRRLGGQADAELRTAADRITGPDWAPRILDLYLGLRSPAELEFHHDCRTSFYLGQWHLINGHAAEAEAALKVAAGRYCRRDDFGYQAKAELLRLKH